MVVGVCHIVPNQTRRDGFILPYDGSKTRNFRAHLSHIVKAQEHLSATSQNFNPNQNL
jgi:hypothetical protein